MQGVHANMFDSCFAPFKLHYSETKNLSVRDVVDSEVISAGGHLWRIRCYPREGEYMSIVLQLVSKSKGVKVIFEAFLMDKDGAPSCHAKRFVKIYTIGGFESWGWTQFVKRSDLKSLCVDGWVTIVYGVIVVRDDDPVIVPSSDIGNQLGRLLDSADGSDVSFVVDGRTFAAYRAVLAARSPVFKAELFGHMAEAKMSHIVLQDIEAATFEVLLRFMYTDTLPGDDDLGGGSPIELYQHLLAAADRYAMDRLKLVCVSKLWDNKSADTIAAILNSAETYNCPELKTKCIAFFVEEKNFKIAVFTDDYVQLVQKFPSLMVELREKVSGIELREKVMAELREKVSGRIE